MMQARLLYDMRNPNTSPDDRVIFTRVFRCSAGVSPAPGPAAGNTTISVALRLGVKYDEVENRPTQSRKGAKKDHSGQAAVSVITRARAGPAPEKNGDLFQAPSAARQRVPVRMTAEGAGPGSHPDATRCPAATRRAQGGKDKTKPPRTRLARSRRGVRDGGSYISPDRYRTASLAPIFRARSNAVLPSASFTWGSAPKSSISISTICT